MQFPSPADHGLGDRFGQYLQIATIAALRDTHVFTRWQTKRNVRSVTYPTDIQDYVQFPKRLHIVKAIDRTLPVLRNTGPGYQEGFDHIPETSYTMLKGILPNVSLDEYMRAFHDVASQFVFKRCDMLPSQPYEAIHLRRGDRGGTSTFPVSLRNTIRKGSSFVVLSDSDAAKEKACQWVRCIPLPNVAEHERALQEFFTLRHARRIIQSVQQGGALGGWSSFSFVPSVMGNIPLVAHVPPQTRLWRAQRFCHCRLFNLDSANVTYPVTPCNASTHRGDSAHGNNAATNAAV